jgi:hypothetical protein
MNDADTTDAIKGWLTAMLARLRFTRIVCALPEHPDYRYTVAK